MLLAEALNERADAQRRLSDLKQRIGDNARVQEDEDPAEDPQALLDQAIAVNERIRALIVAVNITNTATMLSDGTTVTEALARRDALSQRMRLITDVANPATVKLTRWGRAEIREVAPSTWVRCAPRWTASRRSVASWTPSSSVSTGRPS